MESEPKPKRKYVMTPERRAKLMANLEHARRAPKEKIYRKTPERYAANIRNLAQANAKRREELETLRLNMGELFPAPDVPPPPIQPLAPKPGAPPVFIPPSSGEEELDQVTPLIAKRLRKIKAANRREGRSIMRVLTAANRSQPLTANEAFNLARQLLRVLDGSRVVEEVRRLNDKIAHLLLKMIETRYGEEAQEGGVAFVTELERLREERRQRNSDPASARPAAASGGSEPTSPQGPKSGAAGATSEEGATEGKGGGGNAGGFNGQSQEPSSVATPKLPKTLEEFQVLVARALHLEGENTEGLVQMVAEALWVRLHWWKWRQEREARQLEELFQEKRSAPPDSAEELHRRRCSINFILDLNEDLRRLDEASERAASALRWWLQQRPLIRFRSRWPEPPPVKPPARATPDESTEAADAGGDASTVA
jgi:hypothetical protein